VICGCDSPGKPNNQNHALIFTRGEAVQAIDMNQDLFLEEALKLPCLTAEFDFEATLTGKTPHGRPPRMGRIVGELV
jgi:1,3-beta-glucan synthase